MASTLRFLAALASLTLSSFAAAPVAEAQSGASRDSVARDSAARDSVRRNSVARDLVERDSAARAMARADSIAADSATRAAARRDSVARALVVADSLAVDSATRAASAAPPDSAAAIARRVDSLAAEAAREAERDAERAREAARLAETARRDSLERARTARLGRLRAGVVLAPRRPRQGTFVRITLPAAHDTTAWRSASGTFAGEPLHFEPDAGGALVALAAVPVDARPDSLLARVVLESAAGDVDTVALAVPVDSGDFRHEKLRVRPAYGAKPDSALQARIDREYEQAVAVSRRSHDRPRLWTGRWVVPREARVTSGFGNGREFNGVVQSRHLGVDYAGPAGTPVRAANRGIVALVGDFFLGGNVVYLDHGAGLVTAYLHLSRVDVAAGDTVDAGQRIGLVGNTGRSTGPHLHWVARYGAISVDPRGLLALPPPPRAAAREP